MKFAPKAPTIRNADPHGRVDVALLRLGEMFTRNTLEKATGVELWDRGLGDIAEAAIERTAAIPSTPFSAVDLAVAVGLIPRLPSSPQTARGSAKRGRR